MTFCGGEQSVKRSLDDPAPPHTKHTKTAVPQITKKSSQVEGRAVVGRRVRDLVLLHGRDDFVRAQRAAAVLVDELEALARGVFEVERELLDLLLRRLGLHFALGRAVGQLVRQRDLDGLLPALL